MPRFSVLFGTLVMIASTMSGVRPVAAQPSAAAPNCSRAKTATEKAICSNPELAAADAAMASAYFNLRAALSADQRAVLLEDQRRWVRNRDALCGDQAGAQLTACLLKETSQRRRWFTGEGPNQASGAPRLQPGFFHEARKGRYEINVVYPRIAKPDSRGEEAFNKAVHDLVLSKAALGETRGSPPVPGAPGPSSYDATYQITYLGPHLAAVVFSISTYGAGAAHPVGSRDSLIFDFPQGRTLGLAEILNAPEEAVAAISQRCKAELEAQAAKADWQLFSDADFAATVREVRYWAPDKAGVDILFDPYSVAAYAFGEHQCRLSWADLAPWLKPNGPLPPG